MESVVSMERRQTLGAESDFSTLCPASIKGGVSSSWLSLSDGKALRPSDTLCRIDILHPGYIIRALNNKVLQ